MPPKNSIYFVQAEISLLMTAMKWGARIGPRSYHDEENDPLFRGLSQLRDILNNVSDVNELDPTVLLLPFLEVIRSEETTGPITGLALTAVDKFLSYGLIDLCDDASGPAVEAVADAVTHARFVGTEPNSDEVVLMKILHVLRTLLLVPAGYLLSNESVCEIMQSCFRICFEGRLTELLRRTAEYTLMNMVQLLFTRLPHLKEDPRYTNSVSKKLKMRKGGMEPSSRLRRKKTSGKAQPSKGKGTSVNPKTTSASQKVIGTLQHQQTGSISPVEDTVTKKISDYDNDTEISGISQSGEDFKQTTETIEITPTSETAVSDIVLSKTSSDEHAPEDLAEKNMDSHAASDDGLGDHLFPDNISGEYTNPRGVRFMSKSSEQSEQSYENQSTGDNNVGSSTPSEKANQDSAASQIRVPYGLPCVRELLRFIISLICPESNPDPMIHMGLSLLTVALEAGADNICQHKSLLAMVKDEMSKHLMALLKSERLSLFATSLRVCFLLFESMRSSLKFQLEVYLQRLMNIITSDSERISFEQREIALESIVQLWRIPGLVTELYLNYDCDLVCSNLFEDITKLLSKNAFPVTRLLTTHLLSLDALLAIIDTIEQHCHSRVHLSSSSKTPVLEVTKDEDESQNNMQEQAASGYQAGLLHSALEQSSVRSSEESETHPSNEKETMTDIEGSVNLGDVVTRPDTLSGVIGRRRPQESRRAGTIRPNRMPVSQNIPSEEELAANKYKKKLLMNGTEKFNVKTKEGIAYLQTHGLLSEPLDANEVAHFLRETPRLDPKMIGEYISTRNNGMILDAFIRTFNFEEVRIDEALRVYLESFRLPGESPLIQHNLEHFAEVWHRVNGEPFANVDATFTLAYAVVMLNMDQHNPNSKKQSPPMTAEAFKKNLKGINGGQNFDPELIEEIYWGIRNEEIITPSEQTGSVRENYLWKILLRRGATDQGSFLHAPTGSFDHALFTLIWGPTVAALSFVFDKTAEESIHQKAIAGFRKCAMISAHYGLSDVFDNMVISLCKFTTLLNATESPETLPVTFGRNEKAQLAARTVFNLAFRHADILRDGWKNLLDCLLQLFRAKLLSQTLTEVDDFASPNRKKCLVREEASDRQKPEPGMLSSVYLYFISDSTSHKGPTPEEQVFRQRAQDCIRECHIEQLFEDSKFLQDASLMELVKALILATKGDNNHDALASPILCVDEDARVFYFEMLMRVLLNNRDRMTALWPLVRAYLYGALIGCPQPSFLLERTVVGLLRLAIRLLRRQEMTSQVFICLQLLILMKSVLLHSVAQQVVFGLYELIHTHAPNIHSAGDWHVLLTLLEITGAGSASSPLYRAEIAAQLPPLSEEVEIMSTGTNHSNKFMNEYQTYKVNSDGVIQSDTEYVSGSEADTGIPSDTATSRGYTSDSELYEGHRRGSGSFKPLHANVQNQSTGSCLVLVDSETVKAEIVKAEEVATTEHPSIPVAPIETQVQLQPPVVLYSEDLPPVNQFSIVLQLELKNRDPRALVKACETLTFLVRDPAHITPDNFEFIIHTLRVFVEASLNGGRQARRNPKHSNTSATVRRATGSRLGAGAWRRSHHHHGGHTTRNTGHPAVTPHPPSVTGKEVGGRMKRSRSNPVSMHIQDGQTGSQAYIRSEDSGSESDTELETADTDNNYQTVSIQLLDLMHTLHTRAASVYSEWRRKCDGDESDGGEPAELWLHCWCPLLQGIARLCCDGRRAIRTHALTYLQRALLAPDLQLLTANEWEACFNQVLFPLLSSLLEEINPMDAGGMEETRMRAATLLGKVFLQHLQPLFALPTFTALWMTILDFFDKYMHANNSDLLIEAIPESLKNMLLVMDTANILRGEVSGPKSSESNQMWNMTWDRIGTFLPLLKEELFPDPPFPTTCQPTSAGGLPMPQPTVEEQTVIVMEDIPLTDESSHQMPIENQPTNTAPETVTEEKKDDHCEQMQCEHQAEEPSPHKSTPVSNLVAESDSSRPSTLPSHPGSIHDL